jgi:hypothetical protein
MIIVRLMGGLGNQMFQYALGRRISLLRNTNVKTDVSFLNDRSYNHTTRKFELDVFSANIPIVSDAELKKFIAVQESKIKKGIQRTFPFIFPYYTIGEPKHEFDSQILNSPENSLLIGYWQTEKYFLPIHNSIRGDFAFKKPLDGLNQTLADKMASRNSVSVHIRRGDYIHHPETSSFHGSCSVEYYTAAIELIKSKVNNIHLYIFSDDISWTKSNMNFDVSATYIDNNIEGNSYIDMQLMSLCKHNIIANSSFSWWGAWLNNNPDKIVVAPAKWFNDSSVNVKDVIPETWHKL